MKKRKLYIIHSEYVQHGMTFNSRDKYTDDPEKADQIYEETLKAMKADNEEMFACGSYKTQKSSRKGSKFFYCFYKYQPQISNFSVEMQTAELE
jgi:hypothetical protein